eukprot:COSAG06_NODE_20788_length_781_cov_1.058651_2_plen_159_part_01
MLLAMSVRPDPAGKAYEVEIPGQVEEEDDAETTAMATFEQEMSAAKTPEERQSARRNRAPILTRHSPTANRLPAAPAACGICRLTAAACLRLQSVASGRSQRSRRCGMTCTWWGSVRRAPPYLLDCRPHPLELHAAGLLCRCTPGAARPASQALGAPLL